MTNGSSRDILKPKAEHDYLYQKEMLIYDRYQVIGPLGFGGFSEVYHCRDTKLGRNVAVKVLLQGETGLTEAHAAARFKHSHIVEVYDVVKDASEREVIIFQYIEGQTLEAMLRHAQDRRLPLDVTTLKIVQQLAEAIDYAHDQGVVHRDIKPSNIILDTKGNAYLTDFGLAEVKMPEEPKSMLTEEMQKRFGGTLPYMSPEQIVEGQPGDARSDLYSLGVVVYEVLTGRFPYPGRETQLVFQIGAGQPQRPTLTNSELPESIDPVLLQVLSKNPQERPESCQAFATTLITASQAYVESEKQYPVAQKLFDEGDWRNALGAFERLQRTTPDFKDVGSKVVKAHQQVQMLEMRERAQEQITRGDYPGAFSNLDALHQIDAAYDVTDVLHSLLDELYRQAVRQYQAKDFEACEQTLNTIHSHQADYPDTQTIETLAREGAARQRHQRDLYNRGVAQMEAEEWSEAVATFEELKAEGSRYKDSEVRLATARHFAVLSARLQEIHSLLEQGQYAACFDKLGELQQRNEDYKQDDLANLRLTALADLDEYAKRLLKEKKFEGCLKALDELEQRTKEYADVEDLRQQAREGIRVRTLLAELASMYQKASDLENRRQYSAALDQWKEIQQKKGDLDFPDTLHVESHAKNGLCGEIYEQAVIALEQQKPEEALTYWNRVLEIDDHFPDRQHLVLRTKELRQAQAAKQAQEHEGEIALHLKRKKLLHSLLIGGGIVIAIVLLIIIVASLPGLLQSGAAPTNTPQLAALATSAPAASTSTVAPAPTLTPTAKPTNTSAPTSTPTQKATATTLPTSTPRPTDTPTSMQRPTDTPTSTPPPTTPPQASANTAVAVESSTIFSSASTSATSLGFVSPGIQVDLLGRSAVGQWLCIRTQQRVTGYVSAPRFTLTGEFPALPVVNCPVTGGTAPLPVSPKPGTTVTPLSMVVYDLSDTGRCEGGKWYKKVYIRGQGGDGRYTYYWDGVKLAGLTSEGYTFEVNNVSGALIKKARVISGDGQQVEKNVYISGANCQ